MIFNFKSRLYGNELKDFGSIHYFRDYIKSTACVELSGVRFVAVEFGFKVLLRIGKRDGWFQAGTCELDFSQEWMSAYCYRRHLLDDLRLGRVSLMGDVNSVLTRKVLASAFPDCGGPVRIGKYYSGVNGNEWFCSATPRVQPVLSPIDFIDYVQFDFEETSGKVLKDFPPLLSFELPIERYDGGPPIFAENCKLIYTEGFTYYDKANRFKCTYQSIPNPDFIKTRVTQQLEYIQKIARSDLCDARKAEILVSASKTYKYWADKL